MSVALKAGKQTDNAKNKIANKPEMNKWQQEPLTTMIKKVNTLSFIKVMTDEMFMITKRQVMLTCRLCYRSQLSREARM